jgi:hypothetical protein
MTLRDVLRRRVAHATARRVPTIIPNAPLATQARWESWIKRLVEKFYEKFWFYHPVKCSQTAVARRPVRTGSLETYTCPGGVKRQFKRFLSMNNFFKYGYGRGGEFAQGLLTILRRKGVRARLLLGYWHGADALWVEAWHPWKRSWIPLDPAHPRGYGRKFPKKRMTVLALEKANGNIINRTQFYKCTHKGCLD